MRAGDVLGPALNAGNFATQQQQDSESLAIAHFQEQQDQFNRQQAQQQALQAAAEADRRISARERNDTALAVAGAHDSTATHVADRRFANQQQLQQQATAGKIDLADHRFQQRQSLLQQASAMHQAAAEADRKGRHDDRDFFMQKEQDFKLKVDAMHQQQQQGLLQIRQHFQQALADKRLAVSQDQADKVQGRFERIQQRAGFRDRLTIANQQVEQLQKQMTLLTPGTPAYEDANHKLEKAMQDYGSVAQELQTWASKAQPAAAAASQPATSAGGTPTPAAAAPTDAPGPGQAKVRLTDGRVVIIDKATQTIVREVN